MLMSCLEDWGLGPLASPSLVYATEHRTALRSIRLLESGFRSVLSLCCTFTNYSMSHIVNDCPNMKFPSGPSALHLADEEAYCLARHAKHIR